MKKRRLAHPIIVRLDSGTTFRASEEVREHEPDGSAGSVVGMRRHSDALLGVEATTTIVHAGREACSWPQQRTKRTEGQLRPRRGRARLSETIGLFT